MDLSVVIAARDASSTLPAQLDALARQRTALRWEVVVADNGSTDDTRALVRERARHWPGLRLVDASAVRGAGHARNLGALRADGRWLAFCDADDVVGDGWVDAMGAALQDAALVAGRLEWRRLNDVAARRSRALPQDAGLQATAPLTWLQHASASDLGIHADLFHALGGFDVGARFLQDTDLCWRAQLSGAELVFAPDVVVHMRLRRGLRGAWRQGRNTGMGQRWLSARYGALAAQRSETEPTGRPPVAPRPLRVLRRAGLVLGQAARIRHRGEAAALCWDLGFGLGFARGGLPEPDRFVTPGRHAVPV
ncbi:glycosyltransferase family A protein [Cellulomonas sp. RIT-PI-Y]|uniref:glycosyltransferase family 2 protein n=1 Tax=Cellulomonas sp. RIT-PI-Y TaxID=3035297 RepID=UPI0021D88AB1|nr:glycosyltransferase family A protein [Cellulomonas sp. RIT-PI-Y]